MLKVGVALQDQDPLFQQFQCPQFVLHIAFSNKPQRQFPFYPITTINKAPLTVPENPSLSHV